MADVSEDIQHVIHLVQQPPKTMHLTIGVDVGGTNTDAVIIKQSEVICSAKTPTTEDVTSGLETAIRNALHNLPSDYNSNDIQRVNIGTTHFVNAVIQRRDVVRVAVMRLCGPASRSVPPFSDFPEDLRRVIAGPYYFLNGGYEYDGSTIISEVDDEEVRRVVNEIEREGNDFPFVSPFPTRVSFSYQF